MQPHVPGFIVTGEQSSSVTGSTWAAVRSLDDHPFALKVIPVADVTWAKAQAVRQIAVSRRLRSEHLVRLHDAIALADGTLALVQEEVTGGSLAKVLGARGQLTPGETVTTLAPLFGALAELHAAGVVHGDLAPGNVVFSADGRPLINDLGVARLLGQQIGPLDGDIGFVAPELVGGAVPSPASDVYALAALGWFCLAGAPPAPVATRPSLTMLVPEAPAALVEVLTSCLSADSAGRPTAEAVALEVLESAPAEPVALASISDPAAEITRRIRVAAVSASALAQTPARKAHRDPRAIAIVAALVVLVAMVVGGGITWLQIRTPGAFPPKAVGARAQPVTTPAAPKKPAEPRTPLTPVAKATLTPVAGATTSLLSPVSPVSPLSPVSPVSPVSPITRATTRPVTPSVSRRGAADVATAPESPRKAATGLLQKLVGARALAYLARDSSLLDLAYAPGAMKAGADRANIATATKNGATYLGLAFVVRDAVFLDGTSDTARVRATILTPAYETGQPDGRKVAHAQEIIGPSVFTLTLTRDGWRILSLTGR